MLQRTDYVLSIIDSSSPTLPVRSSSIPAPDDAASKLPPSESTVSPTALDTNASSSQKRNSLLAAPTRTSSTKNAAEHSPTSTSSTAVTATGDVDATSTASRKRRRRREGGSSASSVTGEEGRSHKQGGIGRFFHFLCCRSTDDEMALATRKVSIRPTSPSRRSTPVAGHKVIPKESESKDVVDAEKTGEDAGASKGIPEGSSVPLVTQTPGGGEKDDDKIVTAGVLVGEEIVVKDNSTAEGASGVDGGKGLSLLDTTPTVTVQAPTPTAPVSEKDDASSPEPGPTSPPESPTESIFTKEEDVEMRDVHSDDASSDDGQKSTPLPVVAPPREQEPPRGDSDSDDESDSGQVHGHGGELVQTPPAEEGQKWLLPPVAPRFEGKKCLVLDLDETLVHSSFKVCQPSTAAAISIRYLPRC